MPIYEYVCPKCDKKYEILKSMSDCYRKEVCKKCKVDLIRLLSMSIHITGSRDSFGIGKEFVDEGTGRVVDNWRTWEKLGYKTIDSIKNNTVKEKAKKKIDKIKHKEGKKFSVKVR